jgi:hypothetical protein
MNDDLPASALGMWVEGHSTSLSLNLELSGPFDAAGQDPEWMLRLEGRTGRANSSYSVAGWSWSTPLTKRTPQLNGR